MHRDTWAAADLQALLQHDVFFLCTKSLQLAAYMPEAIQVGIDVPGCCPAGKVGGARWQGTRTVIKEEDEDAAAASSTPATTAHAARLLQQGGIKWKKMARQILQEVLIAP